MLVGVASLPPSLNPSLWNIGILLHKQATRIKDFCPECICSTIWRSFLLPYNRKGCAIYVHYNLFMLFIGHHKASDFTGQVAIVSHQAIALARRYAGVVALWRVRRLPQEKNIQLPI